MTIWMGLQSQFTICFFYLALSSADIYIQYLVRIKSRKLLILFNLCHTKIANCYKHTQYYKFYYKIHSFFIFTLILSAHFNFVLKYPIFSYLIVPIFGFDGLENILADHAQKDQHSGRTYSNHEMHECSTIID